MQAKLGALVMTALTLLYVIVLGGRGLLMLEQPSPVAKVMGVFILVLPVFGLAGIFLELRFGIRVERLAKQVEAEGLWPIRDIAMRPSGRPEKAAAEKEFERIREELDKAPEDWHSWFNLGIAYDACGDRRRARASMRKALGIRAAKN
ncbi:MAG: hypothetical protein RL243_1069 [Actinomycetota bacterium]|jgi:cytochrome c-type biogenesis protein CcmH/NrfG